nr:enolase-phosphatase E1-like [Nothobranchius furzeri]
MIQGAATTRQQRRRAEKYAQLSFDPSRLEQIMLLTEENNKLKSKLEETQEHFSKATGLPLEGYQLRQQCINLEKQFQASQNQLMESESMRIADRNYISELVQNIQSLQSELEIAKTSDWKRVDVIADEKDTLFNDILIKLRHYKCEIFGLQAAFNEFSGWKGKIKTIHGKTDGLTSSISHLEAKLRDLVKEGDDMSVSKQNDTMVYVPLSELSDIKERNLGLEFEIKDLTTKNDENERLIQELRKKLENSHREEECKSFKSTIEELQTSEAALLKEVYELKETRSMCNEKINRLSQNIEKAEREKMSAEKISESLKQINQQLQIVSSLRDSNQKQKEINIQESHLQKTICLQGQQIKQDDLEGRNEIHQSLNEKNKLKEDSQSSELQLKLDQLKVKLENKQEQYKKLHKDVRSFVETVSDNAGIVLNKKEPVSNQLSTALENIKVYINNTSEGLVSRRNLHKKLTAKAAALRKAEQELESSNKVIDELRIQLEEMKQRHNTELMELELASQEEITKYIKEISQLKDAIKTAEYELEYLKSPDFEPDKELPKKVEELTQELLISKEKQKQLQRINDKQQNECEELRKQISQLSADDGKSGSEGKFEEIFLKAKPLKPKRVKAPLKENGGDNEVLSPGKKAPKFHAGIQETSKNEEIFTDPWSSDSDDDVQKSVCNEIYPKEDSCSKIPKKLGPEVVKMDTSPRKTENQAETSETSKISEQSPPSRFNPKQRQTVLPPVRSRHTGLPQNVLPVPTDEFENSFGNEKSSRAQKYTKSTNELGAEAKKKDTSPMKTEKEKEVISSEKTSPGEFLDSWLKEFGWSDDIIDDRLLPGSDGCYRNETSPKEAKSTKSTNELGAEAKKMDTSPRKTEKDIELSLPGRWSPKNQATTSETSKISEQSPPSRFNPKQRQTVLPPVRSRHTGLPQNVLPVPTDEFENSFGNVKSSRAQKYTKSTNELGAEAKKKDTSPRKTEKEKEFISSVKKSPKGRAMAEVLDSLLEEFGCSDDIIEDRLLPGSDGGYRNETSPKEAKSTKSTNELGAEAKKTDTSPRKTEKDIELFLPGRWSPKNQAKTSETSKISEQSPPSRFNPKQRQTVLPPVRSRHTGLSQNVLPVPTDEFENSFGNENSSRAHTYIKSTNELGAEAKKMDNSPMKTEKEKEVISSENMSDDEFLDLWLKEFGWSDDIIDDRLLPGSDGGYRNETSPKEGKSTKSTNELGAEAKKMDTSPRKTEKDIELSLPGRWSPKNQATTSETSKISEQSPPSRFNPKQRQTVLPPVRSRHTGLPQNVLPVPTDEFENSFGNVKSSRAQKYTKSTNELGAEAKKMDTSPMKTEKEKEVISSENMSDDEFLDLWLKEFGWSDDIIDDRLLPGSDGGYRNETSPKEAKSTKSTNELGAEAKKMDTSPRKTEKDIELSLPGRWSPKNQATTSETSKISEQSPPSRFNPKQRQTVLPPVRSRHTGLSQNVLPVPTDEFENSFGNVKSSRAQKYTKSTNELGAEAKKKDTSPRKTEKEKEFISSVKKSPKGRAMAEVLDSLLEEFGCSDNII